MSASEASRTWAAIVLAFASLVSTTLTVALPAGMFEHAGNADASVLAAPRRFAFALLEAGVIRERHSLIEQGLELAGVIGGADRGPIRHGGRPDKISPPQLDGIDAGHARGLI